MQKKFCDGETQINNGILYSWSYPKILKTELPIKECYGYTSVRVDKWAQTISSETLENQEKKFLKRVKAGAEERKIKSTGIHAIKRSSPKEEILRKFPSTTIERTKGHSFDDGASIFSGRKVLPENRLKYKPDLRIATKFSLPVTSSFYDPVVVDLNKKILKVDRELRDLEEEKKRQRNEVRSLSSKVSLNAELGILRILIANIQNSLPHRFVATKRVQELEKLLTPYVPMPISSDPNSLPSPVKKPKLISPQSAKKRILMEFEKHEPIPLRRQEELRQRPLSVVLPEPKFKVPKTPRRIRPIARKQKKDVEFAQMCANIEVAKDRVKKREERIQKLVSSLFDSPAAPSRKPEEELDRDFAQFEFE